MNRSDRHPDVIVVGAGIVGAACAHELACHGLDILVIDRAGIGAGVTAAGMGHLVAMDESPAELALSALSRRLWLDLAPQLDKRHAFERCGTLWVAADDEEMAAAEDRLPVLRAQGIACEMLDAAGLRATEPALRPGLPGGMIVPDDAVVYAPAVAAWLLEQAGSGRIRFRPGCDVVALDASGVRLRDGETLAAGRVLLANGLHAKALWPDLPLEPKKGHLLITDRYPGMIRHQILELGYIKSAHLASGTSVAFNLQPRPTGQLLIGSSRQFDTADPAVEPGILARMLRRAADYVPALVQLNAIRAWTGIRPASQDGLPLIGRVRENDDALWLAVGHEGLGVTTALATAKLIATAILHLAPPLDPAPYAPARFAVREAAHG